MKVIIAGSRSVSYIKQNSERLQRLMEESFYPNTVKLVLSGAATGADALGENWANNNLIPVKRFIPDWNSFGKRAGPIRNQEMVDEADALVALWDGSSRGTADVIRRAKAKGITLIVEPYATPQIQHP